MFRYHRDPIWLLIPTVGVCGGHIDPIAVIHGRFAAPGTGHSFIWVERLNLAAQLYLLNGMGWWQGLDASDY